MACCTIFRVITSGKSSVTILLLHRLLSRSITMPSISWAVYWLRGRSSEIDSHVDYQLGTYFMVYWSLSNSNRCKKAWTKPLNSPSTLRLPNFRTNLPKPFSATGVDFAGAICHKVAKEIVIKMHIALLTCVTTRAILLKLYKDLSILQSLDLH